MSVLGNGDDSIVLEMQLQRGHAVNGDVHELEAHEKER